MTTSDEIYKKQIQKFALLFFCCLLLDVLGIYLLIKLLHRKDMKPYVIIINIVLTVLWIILAVLILLLLGIIVALAMDRKSSISEAEYAKLDAQIEQWQRDYGSVEKPQTPENKVA